MITQKTVQEILDTAKIEEVVEEFVNLRRRGVNMIGLCPFHNEKTPSFTVSPAKNIFKCFGCGQGGNPVQFLMEHDSLTFPEALRYLAAKYNIEVEETVTTTESVEERQLVDSLYLINEFAKTTYQDNLFKTDMGKSIGLSYFKQRGFREETIRKFGLGFTLDKKDAFTLWAVQKGYNIELLRQLGLTTKFDSDFFRNRVMFSIHSLTGKTIAFAGRILQKNVKAPKYINSPETDIYHKSKVLYGAYFAKKTIRKKDECILVEGYTDVISLHQAGIENVVASSGTSLTVDQIRLVKRYTPNMKILYDGDQAGIKAALRGLDLVLEQDMNVRVVLLPDGEDPDSYLQKVGSTAFEKYLNEQAKDFILFKIDLLLKEAANDPIKKVGVAEDVVSSIANIPDSLKRSVYIKQCAQLMDIEEQALLESLKKRLLYLLKKQRDNKRREERQQARNAAPPSSDPSFPSTSPPLGHEPPPNTPFPTAEMYSVGEEANMPPPSRDKLSPPRTNKVIGDEFQEKDIIRLLLNSGHEIFDEEDNTSVATYILGNMEDVLDDFDNKNYERIAKLYYQELLDGKQPNLQFFINYSDETIAKASLDIIMSPFELSDNWEKMHGITLQTQKMPDLNFNKDSINALLRFKLQKVIRMCERNQVRLKDINSSSDPNQLLFLMKTQKKLLDIRNDLAKQLNTVVLR